MSFLPSPIEKAIEALSCLPGIGRRSSERLVFSLLRQSGGLEKKIAESLLSLGENIGECPSCHHYCEKKEDQIVPCPICSDSSRNQALLCIVSDSTDLVALEKTHEYNGLYHVLHGVISPVNKIRPDQLRISSLLERLNQNPNITEILFALSGDMESEATALYLYDQLNPVFKGRITRLSRGIPTSSHLEYLDLGTLSRAIMERREF